MSVSSGQQFAGDGEDRTELGPTEGDPNPVPQQMKEVVSLMSSINRRLEDCAVEWQAAVSRKQWRILETKPAVHKAWEQSPLARTYFMDRSLDEAFRCLLNQDRSFTEQLHNFVAFLRGDKPSSITATSCDAQNQCPDVHRMDCCQNQLTLASITPLDLSLLENPTTRRTRRSKRLAVENPIASVQEAFADLIKAKINLDTKFLGFEAILNGSNAPAEENSCLCQICSNVLGNAVDKGDIVKSISSVKQKVRKMSRARAKRLVKTSEHWTRNKSKNNQTIPVIHIGDQTGVGSTRGYKNSVTE